jgi:hypothetical protein
MPGGCQARRGLLVAQARSRVAVHRDRRREHDFLDTPIAARLENIDLSVDIDREPEARILAERKRQETGNGEHAIGAFERIIELVDPQDVAAHQPDPRIFHKRSNGIRTAERKLSSSTTSLAPWSINSSATCDPIRLAPPVMTNFPSAIFMGLYGFS